MITLLYDKEKEAVGCVLLQAVAGYSNTELVSRFNSWLTFPTKDMKRITGTPEQWEAAISRSNAKWKGQHITT